MNDSDDLRLAVEALQRLGLDPDTQQLRRFNECDDPDRLPRNGMFPSLPLLPEEER